ncbi:hypothetical protein EV121DRAFT_218475, partial [Schizophyllum commune]
QAVKILNPCQCPPDKDTFIQVGLNMDALTWSGANTSRNVAAKFAVNNPDVKIGAFPTGDSAEDQIARIQASLLDGESSSSLLMHFAGLGKGCPAASTTLLAQQKALQGQ